MDMLVVYCYSTNIIDEPIDWLMFCNKLEELDRYKNNPNGINRTVIAEWEE